MGKIGVGLIGTGYMGKCHALAWNAVSGVFGGELKPELVTLAEVNEELAAARAQDFGFARSTGDWRDMLSDPDIQIISITTPNQFHPQMAIEALEAGKHVYCEKPMAPSFTDAQKMLEAARKSGKKTFLGYNYIQNPLMRRIRDMLSAGEIGDVLQVRLEMDEDFMANPDDIWSIKSGAASGYGALDDFGVHTISLLVALDLHIEKVMCHMTKPYASRKDCAGNQKSVETYDAATVMFELSNGGNGTLQLNRSAWGRKGRIAIQIFGSKGSIVYDQERMNELKVYKAQGNTAEQGYTTILAAPAHPPYDRFIPAPGHGLGFNDLKIIEVNEILMSLQGHKSHLIDFEKGISIEGLVHAMALSHDQAAWVDVAPALQTA
ncbi:Glucose--fructose oxidoreductase precursor [Pseudovibrio axinellae]|uniref:Glucose--fructose oxidoreductase n=1 Tax=Pseudovibrio axinellae TaxID=989403 RepID=A0A165YMU5_9HYPH|nr:Gfo/Idh/MocA family oxidoreductase [Pseudovibrio axinellae]KZL18995.1 Glucose--fructose oxidoreductase precursor [Pseudovibrio axinellae]SEP84689.1 Predicted dehydrogenase [Pseudovibrio axinellae]